MAGRNASHFWRLHGAVVPENEEGKLESNRFVGGEFLIVQTGNNGSGFGLFLY